MPKSIHSLSLLLCLCASGLMASVIHVPGLTETQVNPVGTPFTRPTGIAAASGGRVFVLEQDGLVKVVQGGTVTTALNLAGEIAGITTNEAGLIGIALDPNFDSNGHVYLHYSVPNGVNSGGRVARFTMNSATTLDASSKLELLNLSPASSTNHVGGGLAFGADGNLYIAVGDRQSGSGPIGSDAQDLTLQMGKILRITPTGGIPVSNPYAGATDGSQYVWAFGFRNPFRMAFQPGTDVHFVNDVGEALFEEINSVGRSQTAGSAQNFGWGAFDNPNNPEGPVGVVGLVDPAYSYAHASFPGSCGGGGSGSITGGAFFNPSGPGFGGPLQDDYFYADFCHNTIRSWETTSGSSNTSALLVSSLTGRPIDLAVSADGGLYYLTRSFAGVGDLFLLSGTAVPEPATLFTMAAALALLLGQTRFKLRPARVKCLHFRLRRS